MRSRADVGDEESARPLTWDQRRFLFVLGVPAFGLALAYTLVTTYVPVLLSEVSGPAVTGLLIGGEGALALVVPALAGGWSGRVRGRLPFVLAGAGLAVAALVLLPWVAGSLVWVAVALAAFFVGYLTYYTPYYALYPDLVPHEARGRSQGFQGALRSAGLLLALAGGGVLLSLWQVLPFVVGAAVLAGVTVVLFRCVRGVSRHGQTVGTSDDGENTGSDTGPRDGLRLMRDHPAIRHWALANSCWEAALGVLRTFVVLYFTVGLGFSLNDTSAALALVGLGALVAAPLAGKLADRYGPRPVMLVSVWVFAVGLAPTLLTTNSAYLIAVAPVAVAAVVLMTLPYTLLMTLMPVGTDHGAAAGLFGLSRGVGLIAGPLLGGLAAATLDSAPAFTFTETGGYSAIFAVAAVFLVASIVFLRRLNADPGDQE